MNRQLCNMERPWASVEAFYLESSLKSCKLKFEGSFRVKFHIKAAIAEALFLRRSIA